MNRAQSGRWLVACTLLLGGCGCGDRALIIGELPDATAASPFDAAADAARLPDGSPRDVGGAHDVYVDSNHPADAAAVCTGEWDAAADPESDRAQWRMPDARGPITPSYAVTDDTVLDQVTGLTWERTASARAASLAEARCHCAGLTLGGATGWRLPSAIEGISIMDFPRQGPALDPSTFQFDPLPDISAGPPSLWGYSSTLRPPGDDPRLLVYLDFWSGGAGGQPPADLTNPAWPNVRCVRAEAAPASAGYQVGSDTVLDTRTGLTWQRVVTSHPDYSALGSVSDCRYLDLDGDGWRLPSLKELLTLVDVRRIDPLIDTTVFPDAPATWFWSSTPTDQGPGVYAPLGLDFLSGQLAQVSSACIRCVR